MSTRKTVKMSFWQIMVPPSILLLAAIEAKLIGPYSGLQVDKPKVGKVTASVDSPFYFIVRFFLLFTLIVKNK